MYMYQKSLLEYGEEQQNDCSELSSKSRGIMIYTMKDGEASGYIVWKHYGKTAGILERVSNANRHLAEYDAVPPAGTEVTLHDITPPANNQKIKMWQLKQAEVMIDDYHQLGYNGDF